MIAKGASILLLMLAGAGMTGCLIIPVPRSTREEGARGRIDQNQVDFLHDGETRRRDVLLQLGEPDETLTIRSDSYDCYLCDVSRSDVHLVIVIPTPTGAVGGAATLRSTCRSFLFIKFDEAGVVTKHAFANLSFNRTPTGDGPHKSLVEMIRDWESGRAEPPASPTARRK